MENTIVGISTPINGAISIIRLSGDKAIEITNSIFDKDLSKKETHTITYGFIMDKEEKIDEVLVSIMLAPKTYTTKDIVEINAHGGYNTTNKILELLLENGATLAQPGEFTKQAFLNGRIDLTKAEAVNDLITAKTNSARKMAMNAVSGKLNAKINNLRDEIVKVISNIEVNIDYPEYTDEVQVTDNLIQTTLKDISKKLEVIIEDSKNAKLIKSGVDVALIGKPNVGKSSLLNAFLDEEKAIVTNIEGTTRDTVEGSITLKGIEINFIDTAGIRNTDDLVESLGVEKSKKLLSTADLVILVLNNNEELTKEEEQMIENLDISKSIIFINKSDLKNTIKIKKEYVKGNTINIEGIDTLKNEIINKLKLSDLESKDLTYLANTRQVELIKKAKKSLDEAISANMNLVPLDMVEMDLQNTWRYLGEITGEYYEDELVDNIFKNFCLGK